MTTKQGYKTFSKVFGCGGSRMHKIIAQCAYDVFGISNEEFYREHWVKNLDNSGSNRPWITKSAYALDDQWRRDRDPSWLYSHKDYKWDSISCSTFCSSGAATSLISWLKNNSYNPTKIMDFGAGAGITSVLLAANFPNAMVHHIEINKDLKKIVEWFKNRYNLDNLKSVNSGDGTYDVIAAFEVVEHFPHKDRHGVGDPMSLTDSMMLSHANPDTVFAYATEWRAENNFHALGHFQTYTFDGKDVPFHGRPGGQFTKAMASRGWKKVWKGYNCKPQVYLQRKALPVIT